MKKLFSLALILASLVLVFVSSPGVLALTQIEIQRLYNDAPWYNPSTGTGTGTGDTTGGGIIDFCLGGPGGSGPLYGPFFPKVPDTAALATAIDNYIRNTRPDSPLVGLGNAYVGFGQKYNVSPVLVLGISQKDTSLATAGYGRPPKYNIGNIRGPDGGDGTGFKTYAGYPEGLEAIFQDIAGGQYLGAPANETTIAEVISTYAPEADGNDTAGYIQFVGDVMKKVFGDLKNIPPDVSADNCSTGGGGGTVDNSALADLAKKILAYKAAGKYSCDNGGDCVDLQNTAAGTSIKGGSCLVDSFNPKVLQLIVYLLDNGFKIGTYALCSDHPTFDGRNGRGHVNGDAVDIDQVNGAFIGQDNPSSGAEGLKLDQFLTSLPAALNPDQLLSYGYGNHYYAPMAALQMANGALCTTTCVSFYTLTVENEHTNHIHVGY